MQDPPDAAELLGAIADTLEERVLPHTDERAQHQVRVAASLCRILAREASLGPALDGQASAGLADLLGTPGDPVDQWRDLADRLRSGEVDDEFVRRSHAVALDIVRGKLAVAKPGYDDYDFASEVGP